jgi:hypothetical protein
MTFKNDNRFTHFVHFALKASADEIRDLKRREANERAHMLQQGERFLPSYSLWRAHHEASRYARAMNIINAWAKGRPFSSAERYRYKEPKLSEVLAKARGYDKPGANADRIYGICRERWADQQAAITVVEHILRARVPHREWDINHFKKWVAETPESEELVDRLISKVRHRQAA